MDIITVGHHNHIGYKLPIRILSNVLDINAKEYPCYKIIHIKSGSSGSLINKKKNLILSPSVICLNESDSIKLEGKLIFRVILFMPEIVNGNLSFSSINNKDYSRLGLSGNLDLFWAGLFSNRDLNSLLIPLAPLADKAVTEWMDRMSSELIEQGADLWPCRARSYLIELLFLIGKIYHTCLPKIGQGLQSFDSFVTDIILIYNRNEGLK